MDYREKNLKNHWKWMEVLKKIKIRQYEIKYFRPDCPKCEGSRVFGISWAKPELWACMTCWHKWGRP